MCATKWVAAGTARIVGGGGKRTRYEIHETADPALARVKFPDQIGTDLRQVSESKRREALARRQTLVAWETAKKAKFSLGFSEAQITAQFLAHLEAQKGERLSRATLYNWEKAWRQNGLIGLVDRRGGESGAGEDKDCRFFEEVKRLYLLPRRLKLSVCWEMAKVSADRQGWRIISDSACRKLMAKVERGLILKLRFGEEAYVNEAEPFLERDYSTLASNELWCADHHQMDVLVKHDNGLVRPWLTAWQDVRSRKIVGWRLFRHDPNTQSILIAFRSAVMEHGVPERILIDNGKDFDSYALHGRTKKDRWQKRRVRVEMGAEHGGIFASLGIETIHALPYHGQSKPIERWFGTIELRNMSWPTYCGNNPQNKPEDLQLQIERGAAPAFDDYVAWFGDVIDQYNGRAHKGDSMGDSPDAIFAANLAVKRTAKQELLDLLLLEVPKPVKVMQNGVTYRGLRYGQYELAKWLGQEVILRVDDRDLSVVQVWSGEGKFLTLAHANQKVPANATTQELREAMSLKKQIRRDVMKGHEQRPRMADDLPDLITRARAAKIASEDPNGNQTPPPPPSLMPLRSPLEDQLPALQRALKSTRKIAVGAESMSESLDLAAIAAASRTADADASAEPDPFQLLRNLSEQS